MTLYLLFCSTGVPWDCGAYHTNNFPKDKSHMLCIWPDRLYELNTRNIFSFGVIVIYVLDSANDYLFYLLSELFVNNLVLAILFTMLQILYCNLFNGKLCACQAFYLRYYQHWFAWPVGYDKCKQLRFDTEYKCGNIGSLIV